ncbi:ABC transporter permease [bacterium]|nr:ABC transporter permease [bacterium]
MFKNYLKIAVRNLSKSKWYSLITIAGLAIGMSACVLIVMYVRDELKYDRFHANAERTYRVTTDSPSFGHLSSSAPALADVLKTGYPEVEKVTQVFKHWFSPLIAHEQTANIEEKFFFADESFFDVFSFELSSGDARTALQAPFTMVITQAAATKYFGNENPVGKTLWYNSKHEFTITGVLKSVPYNTHVHPDFIASASSLPKVMWPTFLKGWGQMVKTYAVLNDAANASPLENKLSVLYARRFGDQNQTHLKLQPITDIHLYSHLSGEFEENNDVRYVYLLTAIAAIILLISVINYVNLATARSQTRLREIGMRKILGAYRRMLIVQFLTESVIIALVALFGSIVLIEFALPVINQYAEKQLVLNYWSDGWMLFAMTLVTGLGAGLYPAVFLSRMQPAKTLRPQAETLRLGGWARQSLVVLQFSASIAMAIATMIILDQLRYMQSAELGFNKQQVLIIPMKDESMESNARAFSSELTLNSKILSVSSANAFPGKGHAGDYLGRPGTDETIPASFNWITEDFVKTLGLKIIAGRNVSSAFPSDPHQAALLNESAVKAMGIELPDRAIGKTVFAKGVDGDKQRTIVGVVADFHFQSLHHVIEPMVLLPQWDHLAYMLVRIDGQDIPSTIKFIGKTWEQFAKAQPFTYTFLDQEFDRHYRAEQDWSSVMSYGTMIALGIAVLGLLGLAAFTTQRRTKEIGIRKVLGATSGRIITMISADFLKLILIANVLAWPAAYWLMTSWLENFAYRTSIHAGTFIAAGSVAMIITLLAVGIQSIRAANANPVDALKYE